MKGNHTVPSARAVGTTVGNESTIVLWTVLALLVLYAICMRFLGAALCCRLRSQVEEAESEERQGEPEELISHTSRRRKKAIREGIVIKVSVDHRTGCYMSKTVFLRLNYRLNYLKTVKRSGYPLPLTLIPEQKVLGHRLTRQLSLQIFEAESDFALDVVAADLHVISANESTGACGTCMLQASGRSKMDAIPLCYICLEPYAVGQDVSWSRNLRCNHAYHYGCILEWLLNHDECPCCREEFVGDFGNVNIGCVCKESPPSTSGSGFRRVDDCVDGDNRSDSMFCVLHGRFDPETDQVIKPVNSKKELENQSTDYFIVEGVDLEIGFNPHVVIREEAHRRRWSI